MTTYGYARVSTPKQDIERQVRNLLAYDPTMTLYREQYSARTRRCTPVRDMPSFSHVYGAARYHERYWRCHVRHPCRRI